MKWIIAFTLLVAYFIQVHVTMLNTGMQENAYERFTYACEIASHDASLDVTPNSVSDGFPIFNQTEATTTFDQDLAENMQLNPNTLAPLPGTLYQQPVQILLEQFFDYSNTSFPYHYTNSTYGIDVTLNGPAIVYVVQAQIPSIEPGVSGFSKTWSVVQGYPDSP